LSGKTSLRATVVLRRRSAASGYFVQSRERGPHAFEIVESADFGPEYMHDDITRINNDPVCFLASFDTDIAVTVGFDSFLQFFGKGCDLPRGAARGNYHVIGEGGLTLQVDRVDFFRLVGIKRLKDEGFQRFGTFLSVCIIF
jgi:hypothetical protein